MQTNKYSIRIIILNHIITYRLLVFDMNTWNHIIVHKLSVLGIYDNNIIIDENVQFKKCNMTLKI